MREWAYDAPAADRPSLGELYLSTGCYEEAAARFERALALDPDFSLGHENLVKTRIELTNRRLEEAVGERDAEAVTALYTENGQLLPAGMDVIEGTRAIERFWKDAFDAGLAGAELETLELYMGAGGETTTEVGRYRFNGGNEEADMGKYIVMWQRTEDTWRRHRDIWTKNRATRE